ncbi:MAG: hypothetical protein ACE361_26660 [Aureliella sp.]
MNSLPGEPDLSAAGWQQRYDDKQTGWDRGEPNPALLKWLESNALPPGRVFVPGCGRGHVCRIRHLPANAPQKKAPVPTVALLYWKALSIAPPAPSERSSPSRMHHAPSHM